MPQPIRSFQSIDLKNKWVPIIAAVIFLLCIAYMTYDYESKKTAKESFVNSLNHGDDVTAFTKDRTKVFVQKGLYAFYCASPQSIFANYHLESVARFVPNYLDYFCRLNDVEKGSRCKNMFIDYFASRDDYVYSLNDEVCNTVNTSIENKDPEISNIRIQNTLYALQKRCTMFDNLRVSYVNGDKLYVVTFSGQTMNGSDALRRMSSFILCRPLFISLNSYGLYKIVYDANKNNPALNRANMFIEMSSEDNLSEKVLYLERVTQAPTEQPLIHHSTTMPMNQTSDITAFFKESLESQSKRDQSDLNIERASRLPLTIYYMNYMSSLVSDDKTNVFTFVIDQNLLRQLVKDPNAAVNVAGAISGHIDSISMVYNTLKVQLSESKKQIEILLGGSNSWMAVELHPKFLARLPNLNFFTVVVCCSYDIYTTCAFAGDHYYMTRRELPATTPGTAGFSFSRASIEDNLKRFPSMQLNTVPGMEASFKYDSIPNFALLGRYFGYNV